MLILFFFVFHRVKMGYVTDVSEEHTASVIRAEWEMCDETNTVQHRHNAVCSSETSAKQPIYGASTQ